MPDLRSLVVGVALLLLGVGMLVWLGADLAAGQAGVFATIARAASAVLWCAFAAIAFSERAVPLAVPVAVTAVGVVLVALATGLLATPDDFIGSNPRGPQSRTEARVLGGLLGLVLVAAAGWWWRSGWWRSGTGKRRQGR